MGMVIETGASPFIIFTRYSYGEQTKAGYLDGNSK
jgi:hypothetical protein